MQPSLGSFDTTTLLSSYHFRVISQVSAHTVRVVMFAFNNHLVHCVLLASPATLAPGRSSIHVVCSMHAVLMPTVLS